MDHKIMKRISGIMLSVLLGISIIAVPKAEIYGAAVPYDAIGHWAEKAIRDAVSEGVVQGYTDGSFKPDDPVTRAEFSRMVNSALGNTGTSSAGFTDVNSRNWYYNDVRKAVSAGYVSGYPDNTFKPDSHITRQETAVMISRFVPTYGHSTSLTRFSDYRNVESWAKPALERIVGKGYMGAYDDGLVHPNDRLTRAQAAMIVMNIVENEDIMSSDLSILSSSIKPNSVIYSNDINITKSIGAGDVSISNCVILGSLNIYGGGTGTITTTNCRIAQTNIQKEGSSVRLLLKGESYAKDTYAKNIAILQTSGLSGESGFGTGFDNISIAGDSEITLNGTFNNVSIDGADAAVILSAGKINNLTVSSTGRRLNMTIDSGATVVAATVNGIAYFHGIGSITTMYANVNSITYEKKPGKIVIGSGVSTAPILVDPKITITPSPAHGSSGVYIDTKIKLTFNKAIRLYDGSAITGSNISDFVELRSASSSGTRVAYSASIDTAKKVITVDPDSDLTSNTRFYIMIDEDQIEDYDNNGNDEFSSYFTTGDVTSGYVSFSPKNGTTGVTRSINPVITFSEKMINYDGTTITNSDLQDIITFRQDSSSGTAVTFAATIDTAKRAVTLKPDTLLSEGTKYFIGVNARTLKTSLNKTVVPSYSVTWTTEGTRASVSISTISDFSSIDVSVKGSVPGTIYAVLIPESASVPSAEQIIEGKDSAGKNALDSGSVNVTDSAIKFMKTFTGLNENTTYKVHSVLDPTDTSYMTSPVASKTVSTTIRPSAKLDSLAVAYGTSTENLTLNSSVTQYTVTLPFGTTAVTIAASTENGITSIDDGTPISGMAIATILVTNNQSIVITSSQADVSETRYILNFKIRGNTAVDSVVVKLSESGEEIVLEADATNPMNYNYAIPENEASVGITVRTEDPNATISSDSGSWSANLYQWLDIASNQIISFTIASNSDSANYNITITR